MLSRKNLICLTDIKSPDNLMDKEPLQMMKVSIFMNVFNVHVNRIPVSGKVVWLKYIPGTFLNASLDKSSENNERMIAKSFHVEGPTWAPNGRFLMYFKEERTAEDGSGGESSLYSVDLTGFNERKVITPLGGSDPAWSPLMH